ncbi:cas scaffolding protein family member 4 isoform X1 [Fukomys damarensis]|uniref:cas scaffolding protein family member 4 isoform X1 n=1 Tax=Fukomys damarensis TaxID=885580 RepID=UPI0014552F5A|nr:cas scaffolding protein family member 4 isoform X1 [Fukomys damarensis]
MRGTGIRHGVPEPQTLLARALYNNRPDCSDELAFSRGDILTILDQDVPESEGWWKCLLHGRQGLAPANRLEVLTEGPEDGSPPASAEETYQVPATLHCAPLGPVYEPMKGWVERSPPPTTQVYEFPDPPSRARIVSEKTLSFPNQTLFELPRPTTATTTALPSQVYDVPAHSRPSLALNQPAKHRLYDIPSSFHKAALQLPAGQASGQSVPPTPALDFGRGGYNTSPAPQNSGWIYDMPAPLGKARVRNSAPAGSTEDTTPNTVPSSAAIAVSPLSSRDQALHPQPCDSVPTKKKLSLPEVPPSTFPAPQDTVPLDAGISYRVPSSFLIPRVEQQNTKPNIYDIPKASSNASLAEKEFQKAKEAPENSSGLDPCPFSRRTTTLYPELDRLSVSSSDSRASVLSSCSSVSTDSSCSSSSSLEDSAKELCLDVDSAKEMAMALQHKVVNSAAGLLLFVSRNWRLRDSLEANIHAIHRAADHIAGSLRQFLDFAQGVRGTACNLTNGHLQARIQEQLQTISNSYQSLLEAKERLDSCKWSLDVLSVDKVQSSMDDLERFVMIARMVPEEVKRFVSIVIANGRLLFKQNCEKGDTVQLSLNAEFKCAKCVQLPQREMESHQKSTPPNKQRENGHSPKPAQKDRTAVCEQMLPGLEEKEKSILEQQSDENRNLEPVNPSSLPQPWSGPAPDRKVPLSEHCRLYFGALFKALGALHGSLDSGQPPEVFITQSKLVITVGQKLVDTLCRETRERDVRNEILRSTGRLCGLLKSLALATKDAVLEYPSPTALELLQAEAKKLEHHTRQFRETLE